MYSPKIKEEYIPLLYHLGKSKHKPMTYIVNEAVKEYLEKKFNIFDDDVEAIFRVYKMTLGEK